MADQSQYFYVVWFENRPEDERSHSFSTEEDARAWLGDASGRIVRYPRSHGRGEFIVSQ